MDNLFTVLVVGAVAYAVGVKNGGQQVATLRDKGKKEIFSIYRYKEKSNED